MQINYNWLMILDLSDLLEFRVECPVVVVVVV